MALRHIFSTLHSECFVKKVCGQDYGVRDFQQICTFDERNWSNFCCHNLCVAYFVDCFFLTFFLWMILMDFPCQLIQGVHASEGQRFSVNFHQLYFVEEQIRCLRHGAGCSNIPTGNSRCAVAVSQGLRMGLYPTARAPWSQLKIHGNLRVQPPMATLPPKQIRPYSRKLLFW